MAKNAHHSYFSLFAQNLHRKICAAAPAALIFLGLQWGMGGNLNNVKHKN